MSAETITTALFLITAVVASAVLINAIYPVVYTAAGSFSATTHESDTRMRTDFKIIATYASNSTGNAQVWMKNTGSEGISLEEIKKADVFCGATGSFVHLTYDIISTSAGKWNIDFTPLEYDLNNNQVWDPGETVKITAWTGIPESGGKVYFQFAVPSGVWRTTEFTSVS
jgi:flagellar protein FlaG